MKLLAQNVERKGDTVRVSGTFANKWRKPATVTISVDDNTNDVIMEGDVKETMETLHCIAEIAWNNGWRPAGLGHYLTACIQKFTIPKG